MLPRLWVVNDGGSIAQVEWGGEKKNGRLQSSYFVLVKQRGNWDKRPFWINYKIWIDD